MKSNPSTPGRRTRANIKKRPPAPTGRIGNNSIPLELAELIEISRIVGRDPDMVQGGGGNTSVKTRMGNLMYVKASGTTLRDMDDHRGWALLDLAQTRAVLESDLESLPQADRESRVLQLLQLCVIKPLAARPSVESNLHAQLGRVVIHTHPIGLNVLLSSRDSRKTFAKVIGAKFGEPLYIPYVDPGYTLAMRVAREIDAYKREHGQLPRVVLLENHGLFVAAEDALKCLEISRRVTSLGMKWIGSKRVNPEKFDPLVCVSEDSLENLPSLQAAEVRGALAKGGCQPVVLRRDEAPIASEFLESDLAVQYARKGPFTPDQIVYCRAEPLVFEGSPADWPKRVTDYRSRIGIDPRVVIVWHNPKNKLLGGVYYAAPDLRQLGVVAEVYRGSMATMLRSVRAGGPRFLAGAQRAFIEGWEVERFRAALLGGSAHRIQGKVAVVTGAASGLGKGIAGGLTRAGATVLALDMNRDTLEAARAELPVGKYLPCQGDVTDEVSVASAFRTLEASVGGLDILVNAAGIAPPFPLVDFPLSAWRKTLEVNLTGYFLCAREAARLMIRQGSGGSIINLTSKSGLEASKENSAYNATKAGEIHLMRGWALELGRAGIRVNCVAPGNVFKGSQIWNEEYLKACARKKGIKPEEVIPYYTSLSPLGKEIEPEDIANAVTFLVSDEARNVTGQTLVVDGGQVMVR